MAVFYFDTSGIVKRYVREIGTSWVQNTADPLAGNLVYLARISSEVTSAVIRRQLGGSLSSAKAAAILFQFRHDMVAEYRIIEITPGVLSTAEVLAEAHGLRAYDAVQLAAAVELTTQRVANGLPPVTMVSADQELNAAAAAVGLQVEDPNQHP